MTTPADRHELDTPAVSDRGGGVQPVPLPARPPVIHYVAGLEAGRPLQYISPQIAALGYSAAEWLDYPGLWLDRIHPEDQPAVRAALDAVCAHHQPLQIDYRLLTADGQPVHLRDEAVAVPGDQGHRLHGVLLVKPDEHGREPADNSDLASLFAISALLRKAINTEELLGTVLPEIRELLQADVGMVLLLDPDSQSFYFAAASGFMAPNLGFSFPADQGISGQVLQTHQPYTTTDYAAEAERLNALENEDQLGPAVFVPLQSEIDMQGVLVVARHRLTNPRPFRPADTRLLVATGEMVGNTLRRARLFDETRRRLEQIEALRAIDMAITGSMDLRVSFKVILEEVISQLKVDAAAVLIHNVHTQMLEYVVSRGFHTGTSQQPTLRLGEGFAGRAALERRPIHINDLRSLRTDSLRSLLFAVEGFRAYFAIPLITKGQVKGVLEVFHREPLTPPREWFSFLDTLCGQATIAIENSQLYDSLQRSNVELMLAYDATIEGWSHALDLRDKETEGHTQRVSEMTLRLAKTLGVSEQELKHIRHGALLHDIGKMAIPDGILLKPGPLTEEEWEIMRMHPVYAYELLSPIAYLRPALDIPYCHHEHWDGSGYPRGLKGEQIPLAARLFSIVDAWDALRSDRPYRKAWSEERALDYIAEQAGKHFDPSLVKLFFIFHSNRS